MTRVLPLACALLFSACRLQAPEPEAYFFAHRVSESDTELDEIRFRSFRKDGRLASSVTLGKPGGITESRYSLVPPLPSRLSYEVSIPEAARLEFEIGVVGLGEAVLPAPVVFTIDVDGEPLFQETVRRRFGNQWFEKSVDLARWSGRNVTVAFETKFEQTPFIAPDTPQVLAAWGNPVLGGRHAGEPRPDLILVSIDCLRADHVSAYGHHRPTTPSLDALANDGVLFENAVSVSTWTLPTHMSMLTGLMPAQHGLSRAQKRSRTAPYLPEILSRAGYETMGIVSGLYLSPAFGYEEGFDSYRALIDEPAEKLVDAALDRLLAEPRRPRFLFLHFFDAHWPYLPRKEYLEQVGDRPRDISKLLDMVRNATPPSSPEEVEEMQTLYDGEVAYIDDQLGRFFAVLKERGVYDDALIVVTADHGEGFYEHELWQHSEIIYNEVTRVPLIVKAPRSRSPSRVTGLVSQLGILPTFLETIGNPSPFDHPSLLSLAGGDAPFPSAVLSEITWDPNETRGASVILAVSEKRLKYVATFAGDIGDDEFVSRLVREELYDLSSDPGERSNLLPAAAHEASALRARAREYLERVRDRRMTKAGERLVIDDEIQERLRALGYVQ